MSLAVATAFVTALEWYLGCGALFAAVFLWTLVGRFDPLARQGTLGFRLLVFPGVTLLWPLFVVRLVRGVELPPEEWNAHRAAARRTAAQRRIEVLR